MDINDLRSLVTVLSFVTFLGIVAWAYAYKGNRQRFADAANLPFADDDADRAELARGSAQRRKEGEK